MLSSKLKTDSEEYRAIARIIKVFGIRGEVKIHSYARSEDEYGNIQRLFLGSKKENLRECRLSSVRQRGTDLYITLHGVETRTEAEGLIGQFLFVRENESKQLPEGSFFIDDILGMTVTDVRGMEVGTVADIMENRGQRLIVVKTKNGEALIPDVPEIVRSVNGEERRITIDPPEGLIDGTMLE